MVEEVAAKRLEELVARRVEEELERRRDEIEAEVLKRVEEAKRLMEQQMLEELQEKRRQQEEDQKKREVGLAFLVLIGELMSAVLSQVSGKDFVEFYSVKTGRKIMPYHGRDMRRDDVDAGSGNTYY